MLRSVARLNQITDATGAKIVVSSHLRSTGASRELEILAWLSYNKVDSIPCQNNNAEWSLG